MNPEMNVPRELAEFFEEAVTSAENKHIFGPGSAEREAYQASLDEIISRWRAGKPLARKILEGTLADVRLTTRSIQLPQDFPDYIDMYRVDPVAREVRDAPGVACRWLAHRLLNVANTPNIFELSEALALRLLHTDLRGVRCDDVQLPFEAFAIILPRGLLQVWNHKTGWHDATMFVVGMGTWSKDSVSGEIKKSKRPRPAGPRMVFLAYGEPNKNSTGAQDDASLTSSVPWIPGTGIYSGIYPETYEGHPELVGKFSDGTEIGWYELVRYVIRLVANLSLYLSSPERDVVEPAKEQLKKLEKKKGKKAQERRARLRESRVYVVGGKDRITEEERQVLLGDQRSLTVRSLVRGHWRHQAHGPERKLRRFVWIKPHVRNKDAAEALGRSYVVR